MRIDVYSELEKIDFKKPISDYLEEKPPTTVQQSWTIADASHYLRTHSQDLHLRYFYAVDEENKLQGVISSHQLLFSDQRATVSAIMDSKPLSIHKDTLVRHAVKTLNEHWLVALPVVDSSNTLIGMVEFKADPHKQDSTLVPIKQKKSQYGDIFQFMGLSLERSDTDNAFKSFIARMPWLGGNLVGGFICAAIVGYYHEVLEAALILAMFIPLVLTLSESIAMQAMTLSLTFIHQKTLSIKAVLKRLLSEWKTAVWLSIVAGILVEILAFTLHGDQLPFLIITSSIFLSMVATATFGVLSPVFVHIFRLDPRVAAGPVALMFADIIATSIYLTLASSWIL